MSASPSSVSDPAPVAAAAIHGGLVGAAVRTWLRYIVPLTVLSAVALAPLVVIALGARTPGNAAQGGQLRTLAGAMLGAAWLGQLILVGGAAAMVGGRPSQLRALRDGFARLVRGVVPCLAAAVAIILGGVALVVPGALLLVLLSLTAASPVRGVPAALHDSIAVVRRHLPVVAITVAAMLVLDAAIGVACHRLFVTPLGKAPTPAQLMAIRSYVRAVALALVVISPLPAVLLATIRHRASPAA